MKAHNKKSMHSCISKVVPRHVEEKFSKIKPDRRLWGLTSNRRESNLGRFLVRSPLVSRCGSDRPFRRKTKEWAD